MFVAGFDDAFRADGAKIIKTPGQAPNANAQSERWVRTARRDCVDWLLILGVRHLERVLRIYVRHSNEARPHRSLKLRVPAPQASGTPFIKADAGPNVHRRDVLGGLIHEYEVAA
jgi:putative transposase